MSLTYKVIVPAFMAATLLSGCSWFHRDSTSAKRVCKEERAKLDDRNLPLLSVPQGLEAPDPRGSVVIPPLNEPAQPRVKGDPCLAEPPRYVTSQQPATPAPQPAAAPAATR